MITFADDTMDKGEAVYDIGRLWVGVRVASPNIVSAIDKLVTTRSDGA